MAGNSSDVPPQPRRRNLTVEDYYDGVLARDISILPRALTLVESSSPRHQTMAEQLLTKLLPHTGNAIRIGITGAPGAGKSTFIESLGLHLVRNEKNRVAVLAVDPSSGVTGGSILGDKTRMTHLSAEPNAYIRPSPSAGTIGGVARKTRESMLVCEAAGYEVVLVETVGVGQSETMVADMTDCFLAIMLPGAGDELQGIKRGLLELVNIIAVNKADGATKTAAEVAARQYKSALTSIAGNSDREPPAVFTCSALNHRGVDTVWTAVHRRHARLQENGSLAQRRRQQSLRWLWSIVDDRLRQAISTNTVVQAIRSDLERAVLCGTVPPEAAARKILEAFEESQSAKRESLSN